jgi:hypothetical protein
MKFGLARCCGVVLGQDAGLALGTTRLSNDLAFFFLHPWYTSNFADRFTSLFFPVYHTVLR